jgi:hypothetical protein
VEFVTIIPLEYSTEEMGARVWVQIEHAVESHDPLLIRGRNEPSIAPLECRNLRRLLMQFSNLIERTIVFLSCTECQKAIANFNFIAQRIIGVAEMPRTQKKTPKCCTLPDQAKSTYRPRQRVDGLRDE